MAYASISGRARTSTKNPRAFGICDRCGFTYNHHTLKWQFDYAGPGLINKRILVCDVCYDTPQAQKRSIVIPADPTPIMNPRVENYAEAETSFLNMSGQSTTDPTTGIPVPVVLDLITESGDSITLQPSGAPSGLQQGAIMPLQNAVTYGVPLSVLTVFANTSNSGSSRTITVNCLTAHGLSVNSQISVQGLNNSLADGFYSVTSVVSATVFTYTTMSAIPSGVLFQGSTIIATANVGLPINYAQIPQTGV